jgi:phage baseplate assembly protein W
MAEWLYSSRPNKRTVIQPARVRFRDVDCDFKVYKDHNNLLVDNDASIHNQLKNLFSTPTGSEDFESRFGSNIPFRIMEPINRQSSFLLEMDTIVAIAMWMSDRLRLVIPGPTITPLYDEDGYNIELPYVKIGSEEFNVFKIDILR